MSIESFLRDTWSLSTVALIEQVNYRILGNTKAGEHYERRLGYTLESIILKVATFYHVSREEVLYKSRHRPIVKERSQG